MTVTGNVSAIAAIIYGGFAYFKHAFKNSKLKHNEKEKGSGKLGKWRKTRNACRFELSDFSVH